MNNATQEFLEELKLRPEVSAVILFGSWARGNNHQDSDVDLIVIQSEGYKRTIENRDGQMFEIIYTTEDSAVDHWQKNKDDSAGLWEVAKILYDKEGRMGLIKEEMVSMIGKGKDPIDKSNLERLKFEAEDYVKYAESNFVIDPVAANLVLFNKVSNLTEQFFDTRQLWIPAPKQRSSNIKALSSEFYALLEEFYSEQTSFKRKVELVRGMIESIF